MEVGVSGVFELIFESPDGEVQERVEIPNGTTLDGLNYMLEVGFRGGVQETGWAFGFIDAPSYSYVSHNDTLSSHPGWTESSALIGGGTYVRYTWDVAPNPAAGGALTGTPVSGGAVGPLGAALRGCFLSSSLIHGNPGLLFNTAITAATYNAPAGIGLHVAYTIRLTPRS